MLNNLKADRILIVEDNLRIADRLAELLRDAGYDFANAYNPGDAMAIDHVRYQLALVDGGMRDRDGRSIFDYIARSSSFSSLPIVTINRAGTGSMLRHFPLHTVDDEANLLRYIFRVVQERKEASGAELSASQRALLAKARTDEMRLKTEPGDSLRRTQQNQALKTLSDLARSISSTLDLTQVLNKIVDAAVTLTRAEEGLLLLPEDDGTTLYLRAMKGLDDEKAQNFRIKNQNSAVSQVFSSGSPMLMGNVGGPLQIRTEYFVKSLLYVPMVYKGTVVGVLGVNNQRQDHKFATSDQELLVDLAAHAATAIENARLYEERVQQNRQLAILVEAGKAVNSTLAIGDVLSTICQQIIHVLNVNGVRILERQKDETLRPLAQSWRAFWLEDQAVTARISKRPVLKKALEQGAYYAVTHDSSTDKWRQERLLLEHEGAGAMIMIPVRAGNQPPIGILELFYRHDAPEVTNEFRYQVRPMAVEMCALVSQAGSTLPTHLLLNTAQRLTAASSADWFRIWLINAQGNTLSRIVEYGNAVFQESPLPPGSPADPCNCGLSGSTITTYTMRDADLSADVRTHLDSTGTQSLLCLPLLIKGDLFGVVTIHNTHEPRQFRQDEINLVLGLVTQAATALDNARLYGDLERSLEDLKLAQTKLVETARLSAIGELAAVVAHQINNPLTTVIADAELLLQDIPEHDPMREGVTAIHRAGRRSLAVVKRLLSTARREAGERPQPINVHITIHNTLELVTTYIERRGIQITTRLDKSETFVLAKPGLLEDIWLNLLLNARDALDSVPDGQILIESRVSDDAVEVIVRDNGPGIPAHNRPRVFNPFFTTKPKGEGTGLGLYICKQIAEECGGSIELDTAVKRGACFRVRLPAVPDDLVEP
jgi:signal transduction histidine kinase/CheY-like chemotaxis protein